MEIDQKLVYKLEKIPDPGELMAELFRLFGERAAIGTSGQWTGVALIDMVIRAGISNPRVYTVDTLRLFPETYELIHELEKQYNIDIEKVTPDFEAVNKMVREHGEMIFFDSKAKQEYCCKIRKVDPNNKVLDTLDVWITGLRADQSNARSQMKRIDIIQHTQQDGKERPLLKVTPLVEWTEERVKDYIRTHKVPVHKLLEIERDGWHYASLGCIICTTPIGAHETRRAGRWRWFNHQIKDDQKECGLHLPGKKNKSEAMETKVQDLMISSGVKFGTSGARGLVDDMTDFVCYVYTKGFLQYLESIGELNKHGTEVAIAGDYRPSTDRIMQAVRRAVTDSGYTPINCGKIPSPAVALYGIVNRIPAIMVTGSHIPADRNGIKFNKPAGEILKADEAGICNQSVSTDDSLFSEAASFALPTTDEWTLSNAARDMYVARYLDVFPNNCLRGKRIAVYQHSAVGRDIILNIVKDLGADAVALGRSETFIPVDTEAIRPEDVALAAKWAERESFDAIISTDGDSDRPLIADEKGRWLRGDVAGILCARYLGADSVSTPVSCNSAVEKSGYFKRVNRTRIGSPFVIESMIRESEREAKVVVGYEANGGFLTNSNIPLFGKSLRALPTRDAMILHLSIILLAAREGKTISELEADLPERYTASNCLKNYSQEDSKSVMDIFNTGNVTKDKAKATDIFGELCGNCCSINRTDGVRMIFDSDEVIHLRPSGNAPEFRCYNEAATAARAAELNIACMKTLAAMNPRA